MDWKTLLAYITGTVDQELLLRIEYLVAENRILRTQIKGVYNSAMANARRSRRSARSWEESLEAVASIVKPDTILAWHRKLIAQKFDGSQKAVRR